MTDLDEFEICANCGSTESLEDYPVKNKRTCGRCGHETVKIKLREIRTEEDWSETCPSCGNEGDKDDTFFDYGIVEIFKCKNCGELDGYKNLDSFEPDYGPSNNSYDTLTVTIAGQEGKPTNSAMRGRKHAKALGKEEMSIEEKCKKQLNLLIFEKDQELKSAGLSNETINRARWRVQSFLENEGSITKKQLRSVLSAALYLVQSSVLACNEIGLEEIVTESQLERIFGVTRKTIRKWRRTLGNHRVFATGSFKR